MKVTVLLALMLLVSGCLDVETYEVRILREQGDPAVIIAEYVNIYSDAKTLSDAQDDFDELVKLWRGEEAVRDMKEHGIQAKSRELFIRDGKIIGRVTGIASSLAAVENMAVNGSQILFKPDTDWVIVETNGRILKTAEGEVAAWPKEAADLRITFRNSHSSNGSQRGQPALLKLLADYQAPKK